ncbi:MAG: SDR family NAD(P)-dependent oxidoreductase [Actinomycetes bacterium]
MNNRTILVVGGTGLIGSAVAQRLAADGHQVRILTRNPDQACSRCDRNFEIVCGDVTDPAAVQIAVAGCSGVHISLDGGLNPDVERIGAENIVAACLEQGVERITLLSGASVRQENAWYPGTKAKLGAESAVATSGIPYAVFRATFFMESLPRFVQGKRAALVGKQPNPWHWVSAADFAAMISEAFATPTASGTFTVLGPQAMTMQEALTIYCATLEPSPKVSVLPLPIASLMARLQKSGPLAAVLPFFRYLQVATEAGDPTEANAEFGRPTTTLEQWCAERKTSHAATDTSVSSGHAHQA